MAKKGSADVGFFLVDGNNALASVVFDVTGPEESAVMEESHGLGASWVESLPTGLKQVTFSQNGLWDDAIGLSSDVYVGLNQTSRIVTLNVDGNTQGAKFVGLAGAFGSKVARVGARGALLRLNVDYTVSGAKDEGVILQILAAKTANWTGTTVDNTVLTSNGGVGYLEVNYFATFTGVLAKIQHSVDNSVWVDLVTFANVTSAPGAQRIVVAPGTTVNRHLRSIGTVTGSGSITPMSGFARN